MKYIFGDLVERNISYQVFFSLLLVMFAIGAIDSIFLFLNELSDLSESYGLTQIVIYCMKSLPYRLFDLTSYVCLLGLIVGIGSLVDKGELIGTQILGKSKASIAISAFRPVFLVMIIGLLCSEFFIPGLSQSAEENKLLQKDRVLDSRGYWSKNAYTISNFKSAPELNRIVDLTVYEFKNNEIVNIYYAKQAHLINDEWEAKNIDIINLRKPSSNEVNFATNKLPSLSVDFFQMLSPKYLSLSNLYGQIERASSKYRENQLALEFWRKVLQPLVTFSLVLLAMSFLFGPMREQKTGQRILVGISVACAVDITQKLLGSISVVSSIPPSVTVILPALLIIFISMVLLKRI